MEPGRGGGRAPSPCAEDAAGERRPGWQECALGPARRRGGGGDSRACRDQRLRPVYPKVIAASVLPLPGGGAASSLKQSCFLQGAEVKQEARGPPALLCEAFAHLENRPSGGGGRGSSSSYRRTPRQVLIKPSIPDQAGMAGHHVLCSGSSKPRDPLPRETLRMFQLEGP